MEEIKILTENIGQNGLQRIKGFVGDTQVIGFSDGILGKDGQGIWTVGTSSALPSDLKRAKLFHECFKQAFAVLDTINK